MKNLLLILLLWAAVAQASTPTLYFRNQSGAGNSYPWSGTTSWSTTSSSGASAGVAPDATTAVIFDSSALATCNVDTTTDVCNGITFQSSSNVINFTSGKTLTVGTGGITFTQNPTMTGSTAASLILNGSCTITMTATSATLPCGLNFDTTTSGTYTLNGGATHSYSLTVTGPVTSTTVAVVNKTNSETLTANGNIVVSSALSGSATIIWGGGSIGGNGAYSPTNTSINCSTFSIATAIYFQTGTISWTAGTQTGTGILYIFNSCTLNTNGLTWANITVYGSTKTLTLGSALQCTVLNVGNIATGQNLTFSGSYGQTIGTLNLIVNAGSNTLTLVAGQTMTITNNLFAVNGYYPFGSNYCQIVSSATSPAYLYLQSGATQTVAEITFNYITNTNGSGGASGEVITDLAPSSLVTNCVGVKTYAYNQVLDQGY